MKKTKKQKQNESKMAIPCVDGGTDRQTNLWTEHHWQPSSNHLKWLNILDVFSLQWHYLRILFAKMQDHTRTQLPRDGEESEARMEWKRSQWSWLLSEVKVVVGSLCVHGLNDLLTFWTRSFRATQFHNRSSSSAGFEMRSRSVWMYHFFAIESYEFLSWHKYLKTK